MIKIIIFSDTYKHFENAIKEYEKRLWNLVEIIKLKPSKSKIESEIIRQETEILKEKLEKIKWYKILLYIEWNNISTQDLYKLIEKNKQNYHEIVFVIGWAYWVDFDKIKDFIDYKLSFSKMTFPHSMALLVLLEQIYRTIMIEKWSGYHH